MTFSLVNHFAFFVATNLIRPGQWCTVNVSMSEFMQLLSKCTINIHLRQMKNINIVEIQGLFALAFHRERKNWQSVSQSVHINNSQPEIIRFIFKFCQVVSV